jgi:hypothetical protein
MAPATPPGQGTGDPRRPAPFFGPPVGQPYGGAATAGPHGVSWQHGAAAHHGAAQHEAAKPDSPPTAPLSRGRATLSAALLAAGVVLGVIGLFPRYSGASLASQATNLWPHLIYLAGWAVAAVLIFRGGQLQRTGALIATGLSVVTLGLFIADLGFPIAGEGSAGAGLVLTLVGWLVCAAGSAVAFRRWPADWPRRPLAPAAGVVAALVVAAIGVAATFAPAWDKLTLPTGSGVPFSVTLGDAFSYPGGVIAGDILVMIGLVAAVAVAAMWRPARSGWALIAGAMIPMVAQIVSAIAQLGQTTTAADLLGPSGPAQLGISSSQPASTSFTLAFWLYCMFVVVLLIGCVWLAFGGVEATQRTHVGYRSPFGYGAGQPGGYGMTQPGGYGMTQPGGYGQQPGRGQWPGATAGYPVPGSQPPSAAPATTTMPAPDPSGLGETPEPDPDRPADS